MIFIIFGVFLLIAAWIRNRYLYWEHHGILYEKPEFPYGNIKGISTKLGTFEIHQRIYEKFKSAGRPFVGMFYYFQPVVLCTNLDFIRTVFTQDAAYFIDRGSYYNEKDNPISAHLFNLDNPKWKSLRTKLTPTFTTGKIKGMFHTVSDVAEKFVAKLSSESKLAVNNEINIKELAARFTIDVIGKLPPFCAFTTFNLLFN